MALGTPTDGGAAYSASGGTSVAPAYPAGIAAGDCLVLIVGQKPSTANGGTATTPSGWTLRESITGQGGYGATLGADTGNTNLFIYTKDTVAGNETGNLTVTVGTNNVCWGIIVRIPSGAGNFVYGTADGSRATAPTSGTAFTTLLTNGATAPNLQDGDMAIWAMCIPTDVLNNGFGTPTISSTGTTFGTAVELEEPDSGTGNDIGGYVAYADATAGSSTAAPTVGVTATGTVTNVRGPIALIRIRENVQTLTPSLYTNDQTFHNPTVTAGTVTLTPDLYTNEQTFYSPDVTQPSAVQDLTPALYTNDQTFFSPTAAASYTLTPALYTNNQTFFSPTVATTYELTPARYDNNQTFYSPTVAATYTLTPALYSNAQTFYDPAVTTTVTLAPNLYSNGQTFYSATVSQGAVVLAPDLYTNTQTFFSPVVSTGGALVAPDLYTNTSVFYSATVVAGAVTLTPALYTNGQTFYAPSVAQGGVTLAPDLYTNTQTFFEPTVAQGAATLSPALYTNTSEFFSPTVARGAVTVAPELHTNTSQFFAAAVAASNQISFDEYVDPGYVTPGYVSPIGFNSQQFFAPTVAPGAIVLTPPLVTNGQTFYAPFIGTGTFNITALQAKLLYEIYLLHGLAAPLVVGPTSRVAGDVSQTVADNNGTVTVTTTAQPLAAEVEPGLMIEELAALHGLTAPLVVSAATRTAGSISQVFGTAGNATTVTRQ